MCFHLTRILCVIFSSLARILLPHTNILLVLSSIKFISFSLDLIAKLVALLFKTLTRFAYDCSCNIKWAKQWMSETANERKMCTLKMFKKLKTIWQQRKFIVRYNHTRNLKSFVLLPRSVSVERLPHTVNAQTMFLNYREIFAIKCHETTRENVKLPPAWHGSYIGWHVCFSVR